jgi:hypothetical protein
VRIGLFRLSLWGVLALSLSGATLQAADGVRIVPLVRDGQVLVTFELEDGVTENIQAAIHSGLRTTLTYTVELRLEVPAWVDRTIAETVVSNSVQYDNLTRRHSVSRTIDGRVEDAKVTEDEALVRQWLTSLQRLPLFRTSQLEPNREYYVRVLVRAQPGNQSFWPWSEGASGQAKFTFLR